MKELTIKESDLLKLLIEEPNRIFKREEIMVKIWREEEFPSDWAYDKLISRLREKLNNISNASYLKTIHGVGLSLT
jgi:DNA-binding response OmpR family regulator